MTDAPNDEAETLPEPPPEIKAVVETGIAARGWIVNSYAQFENLLSDLVRLARQLPEYADLQVPYRTARRISCAREIFDREGPLKEFKDSIVPLVDQFESFEDARLLLVHGFTKVFHTPRNEVGFTFELFKIGEGGNATLHRKMYRPAELESERERFVDFAQDALQRFREVHQQMGWIGS